MGDPLLFLAKIQRYRGWSRSFRKDAWRGRHRDSIDWMHRIYV